MAEETHSAPKPATDAALRQALAHWAARARQRHAEPPTAQELLALAAGRLEADRAEALRDRLSEDPELAGLYLDLRHAEQLPAEPTSPGELDAAWERFAGHYQRRRGVRWRWGLAAAAVIALGLLFSRPQMDRTGATYHRLDVPSGAQRDARVQLPAAVEGLAFHLSAEVLQAAGLPARGGLRARLLDASDRTVHTARPRLEPASGTAVFAVPADKLTWGRAYRLVVTSGEPGSPALEWVLTPTPDGAEAPLP